jgi:hypothetical protein
MADDRNAPATKGDIADLRSEMQELRESLQESIRDSQTEVLRAIYGFTKSLQQRF